MASLPQAGSNLGADAAQVPRNVESQKKTTKNPDEKQPDIEFAGQGGETALPTNLPAVVDIYGDVIKTDWHAIRIKANEAEKYEHFSVSGKP
jgi:hypothetical protein